MIHLELYQKTNVADKHNSIWYGCKPSSILSVEVSSPLLSALMVIGVSGVMPLSAQALSSTAAIKANTSLDDFAIWAHGEKLREQDEPVLVKKLAYWTKRNRLDRMIKASSSTIANRGNEGKITNGHTSCYFLTGLVFPLATLSSLHHHNNNTITTMTSAESAQAAKQLDSVTDRVQETTELDTTKAKEAMNPSPTLNKILESFGPKI